MYGRARENSDTNFVLLTRNRKQLPHTTIYRQLKRRALIAQLGARRPSRDSTCEALTIISTPA